MEQIRWSHLRDERRRSTIVEQIHLVPMEIRSGWGTRLRGDSVNIVPTLQEERQAVTAEPARRAGDEDALHPCQSGYCLSRSEITVTSSGQVTLIAGSFQRMPRAAAGV